MDIIHGPFDGVTEEIFLQETGYYEDKAKEGALCGERHDLLYCDGQAEILLAAGCDLQRVISQNK